MKKKTRCARILKLYNNENRMKIKGIKKERTQVTQLVTILYIIHDSYKCPCFVLNMKNLFSYTYITEKAQKMASYKTSLMLLKMFFNTF